MDVIDALNVFSAFANETRLWAFRLLVQSGPDGLSAGDIADNLSVRQNTMSSHLKQLHQAGLIEPRRDGRSVIYVARYKKVGQLTLFLMDDCCGGEGDACQPAADWLGNNGPQ